MSRVRHGRTLPVLMTATLGVGAALLVSACGSSDKLIPVAAAGPLQSDFESVAQAAESGGGDCSTTEAALLKTEQDFNGLPATVDTGLHARLQEGIAELRQDALARCAKPLTSSGTTSTSKASTPTKTQTTSTSTASSPKGETQTTSTQTTTGSTPTSTSPGGGTQAPEEGAAGSGQPGAGEQSPRAQSPQGQGAGGQGGGTGVGASSPAGEVEGTGAGTPGAGEAVK